MAAVGPNAVADFLDSATAGPSGLVLEGEAGIGKTTLWLAASVDRTRSVIDAVRTGAHPTVGGPPPPSCTSKDAASRALGEALQTFKRLGTRCGPSGLAPELDRVEVGVRQSGLTSTEQRVAELAASGMTNRDVAATLFISPKTVEANLSRVYHKLGIRSRAELGQRIGQPRGG
jgi:DNA-binding NarL/FixJ family response regulator